MLPGDRVLFKVNHLDPPLDGIITGKALDGGLIPVNFTGVFTGEPSLVKPDQLAYAYPSELPINLYAIHTSRTHIWGYRLAYSYNHCREMILDEWVQAIILFDSFKSIAVRAGLRGWESGHINKKLAEYLKELPYGL